ncbi:UbiA family prenyltransferase [Candidatus Neomarinimicrobiota bacterium]
MNTESSLDQRIEDILSTADRMFLATSVDGNSSGSTVFFGRDGDDLVFFTFHPTRKAEQIRMNPNVQVVIWPKGQEGIRELQIDARAYKITDTDEQLGARELVLATTTAFQEFMDDEFLKKNNVVGYYRVKPSVIKYVDFHADEKFKWKELPQNYISAFADLAGSFLRRLGLWLRAVRAPFFTAAIVPVLLGAVIASWNLAAAAATNLWDWSTFWLVLAGAIMAQAGTNLSNDYFDHTSRNDEWNKVSSPFNGGSRMIQAGLMPAWKVLFAAIVAFAGCVVIGLNLNSAITGTLFGNSPLLWAGIIGVSLGLLYTMAPVRLGYHGLGEIAIALGFGPVIVLGSHYVLMHPHLAVSGAPWAWQAPLLASIPVALLVMLIVWINQFQDVPADAMAGKRTWVVRLVKTEDGISHYEKPFAYWWGFNVLAFAFVALIGVIGFIRPDLGTPFAFISLLPFILIVMARRTGKAWIKRWNEAGADRQKLPYELLQVNVTSIGVHLLTGLLLVLGYWLGS